MELVMEVVDIQPLSLKVAKRFYKFARIIDGVPGVKMRLGYRDCDPKLADRYRLAADYLMKRIKRECRGSTYSC